MGKKKHKKQSRPASTGKAAQKTAAGTGKAARVTAVLKKAGSLFLTAVSCLAALVAFVCFFAAWWYVRVYGRIGFDSVLYTLTGGLGGMSKELLVSFLTGAFLPAVLCCALLCCGLFLPWKRWGIRCRFFPVKRWLAWLLTIALSAGLIVHAAYNVELVDYLSNISKETELYEDEYRDPSQVQITFPEQKRNLVYILLESMEVSYLAKEDGGAMDVNLIPELQQLAQENVNFSHNDSVGGFREVSGTSWTIGAMVGHTAGVPLKVPEGIADWQNGYGADGNFLPGLNNLQTVLKENGYYQALMVGSDANFGGRKPYYENHLVDKVYDYYTARDEDKIFDPYHFVWWGYEDHILFDYAKQKLTEISQKDQPFAFTMLTVDTHHIGGYICKLCGDDHAESYSNAIACSSRQVAAFVAWLKEQPFYENTTVIISGDHCSMDKGYFDRNVEAGYQRRVYNCFINAAAKPTYTTSRQFCALDMFPTTLAAMGCAIEGNRLGLGTNLFSYQPTLMELMGYEEFNDHLSQRSPYYNQFYTAKEAS